MALRLLEVSFSYRGQEGGRELLHRFSLELPEKGILCLSGPSGCGKTTLLRLLAGLEQPEKGQIEGLSGLIPAMAFQEDRLLPWCTVRENVALAAGGERPQEEADTWLLRMELEDEADSFPARLSGGMKRRVALARALAAPAGLLLLDEPFTGLDRPLWERLVPLIAAEGQRRLIVMTTHQEEEAKALSARRLLLDGPPLKIIVNG
ncbi:MAG: ATP-binding cassette domain-containing protein [Clostridiales bacterium]|nr:ATP-binding cassette domain-containing protein [Clostridiales bacterium]